MPIPLTNSIFYAYLMFAPGGSVGTGQSTFWSFDGSGEKLAGFEWHGAYKVGDLAEGHVKKIAISKDGPSDVQLRASRLFWVEK